METEEYRIDFTPVDYVKLNKWQRGEKPIMWPGGHGKETGHEGI